MQPSGHDPHGFGGPGRRRWLGRWAFLVAGSDGWTDVHVDEVHRCTASGVDLEQQAGAGHDAVRRVCTIPFAGSNGTSAEATKSR
jgi:hypothetical protein